MSKNVNLLITVTLIILGISGFVSHAQTIQQVDSVYNLLLKNPADTNLLDQFNIKIYEITYADIDTTLYFVDILYDFSREADYTTGIIAALISKGVCLEHIGYFDEALESYNEGLVLCENHYEKYQKAQILNNIGTTYGRKGNLSKTLEYLIQALHVAEEINDIKRIALYTGNIGYLFFLLENHEKALEYLNSAIQVKKKNSFEKDLTYDYDIVGDIFKQRKEYDSALYYFSKSRVINEKYNMNYQLMSSYNSIAGIYEVNGDLNNQKIYVEKSRKIAEDLGELVEMAGILERLAKIAMKESNYKTAENYALEALHLSLSREANTIVLSNYLTLTDLYDSIGDYHEAYKYFKRYKEMNDSLFNAEKNEQITELETKYQTEKKDQHIALQEVELEKKDIEVKRKRNQRNAFVGGFVLVLLLAATVLIGYTQKKKANVLLTSQKIEIEDKNVKLETANKENAEKNKKITDSIRYAKRIQEAILPLDKIIKENIEDSFVLYKPRDIVSGDFYWMEVVKEKVLFAAVDCTGHGVPGALVSIVGHNGLNQAVKEFGITEPAKILDKLNDLVLDTFSSKDEHDIKDGMDIAMCCLNTKTNTLEYAGANNPLYLIRNGKLQIYKADKQPIGKFMQRKVFTNQSIALQENDSIYIFSDGYADQFGGNKDKRFTRKQFRDLLLEINDQPMQAQKRLLEDKFNSWKRNTDQIDDVLVMGVRIS